jgi:hypothetical protein
MMSFWYALRLESAPKKRVGVEKEQEAHVVTRAHVTCKMMKLTKLN